MVGSLRRLKAEPIASHSFQEKIRMHSLPLEDDEDLFPLFERIQDSRIVMLGEASHGTSQYYGWRARIARQLIETKNFSFIAVEGDWPDCYKLNRFVKGYPNSGKNAREVLHSFDRWPTWLWANEEAARFLEWLKGHNDPLPQHEKVGFYGLDVYSLWESMRAIKDNLDKLPKDASQALEKVQSCFQPYGDEEQNYARASYYLSDSCEKEVVKLLHSIRSASRHHEDPEALFNSEQNAFVVKSAELYYRIMMRGGPDSWNLRDTHMMDTFDRLLTHHGDESKGIVWAHNTHIGDARFTDMLDEGEVNIGQLSRQRHGEDQTVLVGFASYEGSVIAGRSWDGDTKVMDMPKARPNSWEAAMHEVSAEDKMLIFSGLEDEGELVDPRGHRAVGVIYHPERDSLGNYVPTIMPRRYDALLYIDNTSALRPLGIAANPHETPDTFPFTQ
ncbi:MAG: erythromycin esterase family protein [Proteobacteria bacterium]|nr:MAG: erythromycin esterase family protein [Pseudomonadota bacterium]